jgi:hypothetical protein
VGENLAAAIRVADARSRRRRLRPAFAAGVAAIGVATVLALVGGSGDSQVFTVQEAVAAVVKTAFDQPAVKPDSVLYEKRITNFLGPGFLQHSRDYSARSAERTERWYRAGDKKGWMRISFSPPQFITAADKKAFLKIHRAVPTGDRVLVCHTVLAVNRGASSPSVALHLRAPVEIPTDPKAAYRLFKRSVPHGYIGPGGDDEVVWQSIAYAMNGGAPSLSTAQRAAVIGALAEIPGVATTGPTRDPLGNNAIGFTRTVDGIRTSLYFDSETSLVTYFGSVLAKSKVVARHLRPAGTEIWSQALIDYRYVHAYPGLRQTSRRRARALAALCPEVRHHARK